MESFDFGKRKEDLEKESGEVQGGPAQMIQRKKECKKK